MASHFLLPLVHGGSPGVMQSPCVPELPSIQGLAIRPNEEQVPWWQFQLSHANQTPNKIIPHVHQLANFPVYIKGPRDCDGQMRQKCSEVVVWTSQDMFFCLRKVRWYSIGLFIYGSITSWVYWDAAPFSNQWQFLFLPPRPKQI